jgi:DNA-binding MarR family transcriptional regulator
MNCMRFLDEKGLTARELEKRARTKTNLNGMERWGYVSIRPDENDRRPKPPRSSWLIRPTTAGKGAQAIWQPLFAVIEDRWKKRFGETEMERLRGSLLGILGRMDLELPNCLPILGYGLRNSVEKKKSKGGHEDASGLPLLSLVSKVLLAFATEFESQAEVSIAITANVLRQVGDEGIRVRDLPQLAGVSKEAIAVAVSYLAKRGYAAVKPEAPGSRTKVLALSAKGREVRKTHLQRLTTVEEGWQARFGADVIDALRRSLEGVVGAGLFQGMEPYPDGWRAWVPRPETLPQYPMVLHRGGYPDGS